MLHGKIFRSTVAHGRIRKINTRAAGKLAGVFRVITIEDVLNVIPDPYYGPAFHDQPILAHQKVRYIGEPVAVVLAEDPHLAEQAVSLIAAEYEELPPVFDELAALTSSAPRSRHCHRHQGGDRADSFRCHRQHQRRWQRRSVHEYRRHGAGLGYRDGPDRS
jgi:CO/xanthine dehydrogenase Mo-binding subunit